MGAQRLSERNTRRIARITGLPVIRAWGHGGYTHDFVTAGHLHGWYSLKTGEWSIQADRVMHYDTCPRPEGWTGRVSEDQMFPDGVPPLTLAEQEAAAAAGVTVVLPSRYTAPPGLAQPVRSAFALPCG